MKYSKNLIFISLFVLIIFQSTCLSGQNSYGAMCHKGRDVIVIKNRFLVEYIEPFAWQDDEVLAESKGANHYFFPLNDSINRKSIISMYVTPNALSTIDFDSFILKQKMDYQEKHKSSSWEMQENMFHSSVTNAESFLIKDKDEKVNESIAYLKIDDFIVTISFITTNTDEYNAYIEVYNTLLSSIRCSAISR